MVKFKCLKEWMVQTDGLTVLIRCIKYVICLNMPNKNKQKSLKDPVDDYS